MAAGFVLGCDAHCDVPRGYASFSSRPAALPDDHFEPPSQIVRAFLATYLCGYASGLTRLRPSGTPY